nr:hypothetical protein [Tanacetum cinerariifolium]
MVFRLVDGIRASSVEMIYEMNLVRYVIQYILALMILIRILSLALPILTTLYTPHMRLTHVLLLAWDRVFEIKDAFGNKKYKPEDVQELFCKLFNDVQNIHEEWTEYINTPSWNRPAFYNNAKDEDEDYTIAITPDFLIMDSLKIRLVKKLLYDNSSPRPPEEPSFENSAVIESFSLSPIPVEGSDSIMEEIDIFLAPDDLIPPGIENDENDSEGDIIFLKELLSNDSPSLLDNESFHFDVLLSPRPPTKPPPGDGIYFDDEPDTRVLTIKVVLLLAWDRISEIKDAFGNKKYKPEDVQELFRKLFNDVQNIHEEWTDTIPKTKSDELIKSSVENLVPNPSESEDLSDIESECDVPVCDDFTTFSNSFFDTDKNISSSDDESFSDEDVSKKVYSNPLFDEEIISIKIDPHHFNAESDLIESLLNQDSSIISSPKIDSFLEEFSDELAHINLIPSGINEAYFNPEEEIRLVKKLLYDNSSPRPPEEPSFENSDAVIESFSLSSIPVEGSDSIMEEIDIFLASDDLIPPGIGNDENDSEGDIIFLKELLSNDSPSLLDNESFHFDVLLSPRPPAKPPPGDGIYFDDEPDTRVLTIKVVGDIFEYYVLMPRLFPTQPTLVSNEEKSPHLLSHRGFNLSSFLLKAR